MDHETLLQEKIRLDNEIRCMVESLVGMQKDNDLLANQNNAGVEGIILQEAALKEEVERNVLEIETLMQERGIILDNLEHEQFVLESEVFRLQNAKESYHRMVQ